MFGGATAALAATACSVTTSWITVIDVAYATAVYETVPAVYATEYQFAHRHPGHPHSPRWEAEGWNADSNPHSVGWYSTGVTRQVLVAEESIVLVTPETPEVSHQERVDVEVCEEIPDVIVPPAPPAPPVILTPIPEIAAAPLAPAPPAPAAAVPVAAVAATPPMEELAYTGPTEDALLLASIAAGALLLGSGLFFIRRFIK